MNVHTPSQQTGSQRIGRRQVTSYRRFLGVLALAMLAVALVACGGGDDPENDEPGPVGTVPAGPDGNAPTAPPLATTPEPTIVTGDGTGSDGPGAPGNGTGSAVIYTVESGDFLGTIAANFGVTVEAIREANGLTDDNIFIGQELTIPREGTTSPPPGAATPAPGATQPPAATEPPGPTPPPGGGTVYVVESGDTPLGIAIQFDLTLEELEAANGGPLGILNIGQEIIIP